MTKRMIGAAFLIVAMAAMGSASAHDDSSSDSSRCDTRTRYGHNNAGNTDQPGTHEHDSSSDVPLAGGYEVHQQSGHYVVRGPAGYVEVIGGGSYRGDPASAPGNFTFPGQGGLVQGEVDPGSGAPDADFNVSFFGPNADAAPTAIAADPAGWAQASYLSGCVNVAGTQVSQQSRPL